MLCGEPPYRTPEIEEAIRVGSHAGDEARRLSPADSPSPAAGPAVAAGIDRRLAEIVERCLHVDPEKRFPNAQAVLDTLVLRDRWRARRPLITLGIVGPTPAVDGDGLAGRATARHDGDQRQRTNAAAGVESDILSARIVAQSLNRDLDERQRELSDLAKRIVEEKWLEPVKRRDRQAGRHRRGGQPRSLQAALTRSTGAVGRALQELGAAEGL